MLVGLWLYSNRTTIVSSRSLISFFLVVSVGCCVLILYNIIQLLMTCSCHLAFIQEYIDIYNKMGPKLLILCLCFWNPSHIVVWHLIVLLLLIGCLVNSPFHYEIPLLNWLLFFWSRTPISNSYIGLLLNSESSYDRTQIGRSSPNNAFSIHMEDSNSSPHT